MERPKAVKRRKDRRSHPYAGLCAAFQALHTPERLEMLRLLALDARDVTTLSRMLGVSLPDASRHLAALRRAGLVEVRAEANRRVQTLSAALAPRRAGSAVTLTLREELVEIRITLRSRTPVQVLPGGGVLVAGLNGLAYAASKGAGVEAGETHAE